MFSSEFEDPDVTSLRRLSASNRINETFNDLDDFTRQFNLYGFHDVCNYFLATDLEKKDKDGFSGDEFYEYEFYPPGFSTRNVTGIIYQMHIVY